MNSHTNKLRGVYIQTYVVEFFVFLSALLCFRFAYILFDTEGFGQYSLFRRTIGLLSPFLMLGLQIALTRYIAQILNTDRGKDVYAYFLATILLSFAAFVIFVICVTIFDETFGWLFFGDAQYRFFVFPMIVVMFGVLIHSIVYSYFRGAMDMSKANVLQFMNLGIGNIIGFAFFKDVSSVMLFTGAFWIVVSVTVAFIFVRRYHVNFVEIVQKSKELFKYGIQRIPANVVSITLISLPSYIVTHKYGIELGGYVAFGASLLGIGATASNPVSLILLPQTTIYKEQGEFLKIRSLLRRVFTFSTSLSILACVIFIVFAPQILQVYFGKTTDDLIYVCRFIILALPPYVVYTAMRTTNDAFYDLGVNSISFAAGFLFFLLGLLAFSPQLFNVLLFFVLSLYVTVAIMLIFIFSYLRKHGKSLRSS